jgi:hypothetical protein
VTRCVSHLDNIFLLNTFDNNNKEGAFFISAQESILPSLSLLNCDVNGLNVFPAVFPAKKDVPPLHSCVNIII